MAFVGRWFHLAASVPLATPTGSQQGTEEAIRAFAQMWGPRPVRGATELELEGSFSSTAPWCFAASTPWAPLAWGRILGEGWIVGIKAF